MRVRAVLACDVVVHPRHAKVVDDGGGKPYIVVHDDRAVRPMGLTLRRDVTFEVDASVLLRWLGYAAALAAVLVLGFWAAGGDR